MITGTGLGTNAGVDRLTDLTSFGPDTDGDGIPDILESLIGTDPLRMDSDGDELPDGLELALGSDPADSSSRASVFGAVEIRAPLVSVKNLALTVSGQSTK